jgi:hypothetical protein
VDELNRRISDKNSYITKLEESKRDFESLNQSLENRIRMIERELKKNKE